MKPAPLALLFFLTLLPVIHAQAPAVRSEDLGMIRVSITFSDVRRFSLRHHAGEPPIAPNQPDPTVETSDRL